MPFLVRRTASAAWIHRVGVVAVVPRTVVLAAVVGAAVVLSAAPAEAQNFGPCMRNAIESGPMGSGGALDSTQPGQIGTFIPPNSMVGEARNCAEQASASIFLGAGGLAWQLFYAIAVIIVVWTGIQIMFGGAFGIGEVINLVMLIGVPFAILRYYNTPAPVDLWGAYTFPDLVTRGATTIAQQLVTGAFSQFAGQVAQAFRDIWALIFVKQVVQTANDVAQAATGPAASGGIISWFGGLVDSAVSAIFTPVMSFISSVVLSLVAVLLLGVVFVAVVLAALVAYCSYLWAHVSILVAVFIGPIFVPFIMVPQLSFLFWGWFKSLLGAAVHCMIAAAVFVTVTQLLLSPLNRFVAIMAQLADGRTGDGLFLGRLFDATSTWLLEAIPIALIAILAAFKIGSITSMIMNSGSMPSAGIQERVRGMGNLASVGRSIGSMGGAGAAARAASPAMGAARAGMAVKTAGASIVLSQATK